MLNAQETITAAIEKLEHDRESYAPGPPLALWNVDASNAAWFEWAMRILKRDQRTIDAQLAILRSAQAATSASELVPLFGRELDLARAILGESS